jgi:phosphoglycolate phosphatase-like HAD superfamily hydrolase
MIAVLFDVDLTLLDARRAGSRAMKRVFEELWGLEDALRDVHMAGRTDHGILLEVLSSRLGRSPGARELRQVQERFLELYVEVLEDQLARTPAVCCPGVMDVLETLSQVTPVVPGLATGNFHAGAMLKLESAGIAPERFGYGAFGDDHSERADVVRLAAERARRRAGADVIVAVVGDTPRDLAAARDNRLPCVLVATGPYGRDDLADLLPDLLLDDLSDGRRLLDWLGGLRA